MIPPINTVTAYEDLRAAVLSAQECNCLGLGILRRHGLAAWIRDLGPGSRAAPPGFEHRQPDLSIARDPTAASDELTRLIAGIVLALATEAHHAHA